MNKDAYSFYRIVSPTGKKYYGITGDYVARMEQHRKAAKRKNSPLYAAIRKHTWDGMYSEVLVEGSLDVVKQLEVSAILVDNTLHPNGYNLTKGGDGILGYKHTKTTKNTLAIKGKEQFADREKVERHHAAMLKAAPALRELALIQHKDPVRRAKFLTAQRSDTARARRKEISRARLDLKGSGITAGYVWITNGPETKSLPIADAQPFLDAGWRRGRQLGNVWVTNGDVTRNVTRTVAQLLLSSGWYRGRSVGWVWVTNGRVTKRMTNDAAQPFLSSGWRRGRTLRKERI